MGYVVHGLDASSAYVFCLCGCSMDMDHASWQEVVVIWWILPVCYIFCRISCLSVSTVRILLAWCGSRSHWHGADPASIIIWCGSRSC